MDKVIVNYTGWITVNKNDLKIISTEDSKKIDVTKLTGKEICSMLENGEAILQSFSDSYSKSIDGEDDWTYENEIEED